MNKETRDLLWREHIREYMPEPGTARKEGPDQDELIERAIERLLNRRRLDD